MRRIIAVVAIIGAFVTLLGLGTWQVQRLQWKNALIAEAETRPAMPPVVIGTETLGIDVDSLTYRRAELTGRFIEPELRVFSTLSDANGVYEGPGFWLMRPFVLAESDVTIFVNRGFVPYELPPGAEIAPPPEGEVTFVGLIRPDDAADWATLDPEPENLQLYRRDIAQMTELAGIDGLVLPFTIDLPADENAAPGALPQAGETKFSFTNRHLQYAITWYGLAAVLVVLVVVGIRRRKQVGEH